MAGHTAFGKQTAAAAQCQVEVVPTATAVLLQQDQLCTVYDGCLSVHTFSQPFIYSPREPSLPSWHTYPTWP